jgi:hypothetical protein
MCGEVGNLAHLAYIMSLSLICLSSLIPLLPPLIFFFLLFPYPLSSLFLIVEIFEKVGKVCSMSNECYI